MEQQRDMTSYNPAEDRYRSMNYRRCGRSGLLLPAVSLGLWQNFGEDRPLDHSTRHCASSLRRGHHPFRPGQQLRTPLRQC